MPDLHAVDLDCTVSEWQPNNLDYSVETESKVNFFQCLLQKYLQSSECCGLWEKSFDPQCTPCAAVVKTEDGFYFSLSFILDHLWLWTLAVIYETLLPESWPVTERRIVFNCLELCSCFEKVVCVLNFHWKKF